MVSPLWWTLTSDSNSNFFLFKSIDDFHTICPLERYYWNASLKSLGYWATINNINSLNQGKIALNMPICGNHATFCGKLSKNLLPQPSFVEFHKFFHNLTEFFREQCSHARAKFHVWTSNHLVRAATNIFQERLKCVIAWMDVPC